MSHSSNPPNPPPPPVKHGKPEGDEDEEEDAVTDDKTWDDVSDSETMSVSEAQTPATIKEEEGASSAVSSSREVTTIHSFDNSAVSVTAVIEAEANAVSLPAVVEVDASVSKKSLNDSDRTKHIIKESLSRIAASAAPSTATARAALTPFPMQEVASDGRGHYLKIKESILRTFVNDRVEENLDLSKYFRITSNAATILLSAQEPWPKDVQLYQPYEVEQVLLPDNANCLAVQTFLKMCQLEYKVEARSNAEAMSPTGKVPFIKCGAFIISELEGIVQFVGSKGISLTSGLDAENKADMRAYMTLVNNVLGNAELYLVWCEPETYQEVTKPRYGSVHPWPLNVFQTWSKKQEEIKRLKVIGWYQKTLEEVYNDVETCCQALTDRLDGNKFFFGDKCTELDALVYSHMYAILTTAMPVSFAHIIKQFPALVQYCQTVDYMLHERHSSFPPMQFEKIEIRTLIHDNHRGRLARRFHRKNKSPIAAVATADSPQSCSTIEAEVDDIENEF